MFGWLRQQAGITDTEMATTFNCGIGMVAIAAPEDAGALAALLREQGERVAVIGSVGERRETAVNIRDLGAALQNA